MVEYSDCRNLSLEAINVLVCLKFELMKGDSPVAKVCLAEVCNALAELQCTHNRLTVLVEGTYVEGE